MFFVVSPNAGSEPVPSTSSKPVDNRPHAQEGKQTSQGSVSTSEKSRSNQVLEKNGDFHWGPQAHGYQE